MSKRIILAAISAVLFTAMTFAEEPTSSDSLTAKFLRQPVTNAISFYPNGKEVLRLTADGRVIYQGREIGSDPEIFQAFQNLVSGYKPCKQEAAE